MIRILHVCIKGTFESSNRNITLYVVYRFLLVRIIHTSRRHHTPRIGLARSIPLKHTHAHKRGLCKYITFSASMFELRFWRTDGIVKSERVKVWRGKRWRRKDVDERRTDRPGTHSQVGENHTCPNPLLLAAVFLST